MVLCEQPFCDIELLFSALHILFSFVYLFGLLFEFLSSSFVHFESTLHTWRLDAWDSFCISFNNTDMPRAGDVDARGTFIFLHQPVNGLDAQERSQNEVDPSQKE